MIMDIQHEPALAEHSSPSYDFPESELLSSLVDIYFEEINRFWPLLHRPTFKRNIGEDLHRTNPEFGKIVLLVCASASRWSNDPRVLYPGSNSWHSAGWRWYNQVQFMKRSQLAKPTLYDVQFCFVGI
jgi:hypothetical protein